MDNSITKLKDGVKINFVGSVKKQNIITMVQNCSEGRCECMNDTTKAKIKDMQVQGRDGDVSLSLSGDISIDEIQKALEKSKVLNG